VDLHPPERPQAQSSGDLVDVDPGSSHFGPSALDAVHYLDGAPCLQSSVNDKKVAVDGLEDLGALDEEQWPLHARTGAAAGVAVSSRAPSRAGMLARLGWPRPPDHVPPPGTLASQGFGAGVDSAR
jgi:hypothetical protein